MTVISQPASPKKSAVSNLDTADEKESLRQALVESEQQLQLINDEYRRLFREKEVCVSVCVGGGGGRGGWLGAAGECGYSFFLLIEVGENADKENFTQLNKNKPPASQVGQFY